MERVTLPGLPAKRAADYQLDGFDPPRYARVIYTPQESKPDRKMIEAQAFEVDANGNFVANVVNGMPSRTAGTIHVISISGIGDTHTLQPGWVRVVGTYHEENLPTGAVIGTLPATGNVGDMVFTGEHLYRYDAGMLEGVLQTKANELAQLLRNSTAIGDFEL